MNNKNKVAINNLFYTHGSQTRKKDDGYGVMGKINIDSEGNRVEMLSLDEVERLNNEKIAEEDADFEETPFQTTKHRKTVKIKGLYEDIRDENYEDYEDNLIK